MGLSSQLTNAEGSKAKSKTKTKTSSVNSKYPLNQCDMLMLRDTKKSLRTGMQSALQWYGFLLTVIQQLLFYWESNDPGNNTVEDDTLTNDEDSLSNSVSHNSSLFSGDLDNTRSPQLEGGESPVSSEPPVVPEASKSANGPINSASVRKSSLKSTNPTEPDYENTKLRLQQLLNEVLDVQKVGPVEPELANYAINAVTSDFGFTDLKLIPNQPIPKNVKDSLVKVLKPYYTDIYGLKQVNTLAVEICSGLSLGNKEQDLNNPRWLELFWKLWKADSYSFDYYDEEFFREYMSSSYGYDYSLESHMDALVKTGFFMNFSRFRYYYSTVGLKLISHECYEEDEVEEDATLDEINRRFIQNYLVAKESRSSVDFNEDIGVRRFCKEDPPNFELEDLENEDVVDVVDVVDVDGGADGGVDRGDDRGDDRGVDRGVDVDVDMDMGLQLELPLKLPQLLPV